jgi:hypothetical protein
MSLDVSVAAAGRTEAARQLIGQAQAGPVDLVTVSAVELCVLGGPRHPVFDESAARAWMRLGRRPRAKLIQSVTEGLAERGLLIGNAPRTGVQQPDGSYAMKPELGLMLAARCRPSFVVLVEADGQDLRTPRFFALGDAGEPVRGIVAELPAVPPHPDRDLPRAPGLGPLGLIYRHVLLSREGAADVLARWTISPPRRSGEILPGGYLVSVYHPDRTNPFGYRLRVRGDGATARLVHPGASQGDLAAAEYDADGLRAVMLDLLTRPWR